MTYTQIWNRNEFLHFLRISIKPIDQKMKKELFDRFVFRTSKTYGFQGNGNKAFRRILSIGFCYCGFQNLLPHQKEFSDCVCMFESEYKAHTETMRKKAIKAKRKA